jgi:hypothetical protein
MPFFHVVGNYDMSNPVMSKAWNARLGRDYYHFVQDGVLFIALNSEDPPAPRVDRKDMFAKYDRMKLLKLFEVMQADKETQATFFAANPRSRQGGGGAGREREDQRQQGAGQLCHQGVG